MSELPRSARVARLALKVLILPMALLGIAVRFAAPGWADFAFLGLFGVALLLLVIGRVFTRDDDSN